MQSAFLFTYLQHLWFAEPVQMIYFSDIPELNIFAYAVDAEKTNHQYGFTSPG